MKDNQCLELFTEFHLAKEILKWKLWMACDKNIHVNFEKNQVSSLYHPLTHF